jgi:hypothetical protein
MTIMRSDQIRDNEPVGTADWLGLAAAPTFGVMALLAAFNDGVDAPSTASMCQNGGV